MICPCINSINAIAYWPQALLHVTPPSALRSPAIVDANINMPTCLRLPRSHRFARSTADDVELTFNSEMLYHCNCVPAFRCRLGTAMTTPITPTTTLYSYGRLRWVIININVLILNINI